MLWVIIRAAIFWSLSFLPFIRRAVCVTGIGHIGVTRIIVFSYRRYLRAVYRGNERPP